MVELIYKELTFAVIGAAMEVHRILGPGFLEAVHQTALERELMLRGIPFERKVKLPVTYKDVLVGEYEADLVIDKKIRCGDKSGFQIQCESSSPGHALFCRDRSSPCPPAQFRHRLFGTPQSHQVNKKEKQKIRDNS